MTRLQFVLRQFRSMPRSLLCAPPMVKTEPETRVLGNLYKRCRAAETLMCARVDRLAGLFSYVKPTGGYYVFATIETGESSIDFALRLLNDARVITIPGSAFGPTGENHIRFSFGGTEEEINEALIG